VSAYRIVWISVLSVLIVSDLGYAQALGRNTGAPFTVSLSSDRASGKRSDSIVFSVTLANAGSRPVFVYGKLQWGLSSSLFLVVTDNNGKSIQMSYLEDTLPSTPKPGDRTAFIKLNPNHFFGTSRTDKLSALVPGPGTYYFQVEYHAPVSKRFGAGLPIWGSERPPVLSNKIKIDVQ
jgi:hypothetical protein